MLKPLFSLLILTMTFPSVAQSDSTITPRQKVESYLTEQGFEFETDDIKEFASLCATAHKTFFFMYALKTEKVDEDTPTIANGSGDSRVTHSINLWKELYFNSRGEWLKTHTVITDIDCEILGANRCEEIDSFMAVYKEQYGTDMVGTFKIEQNRSILEYYLIMHEGKWRKFTRNGYMDSSEQ